jgi:hypothetical protein
MAAWCHVLRDGTRLTVPRTSAVRGLPETAGERAQVVDQHLGHETTRAARSTEVARVRVRIDDGLFRPKICH